MRTVEVPGGITTSPTPTFGNSIDKCILLATATPAPLSAAAPSCPCRGPSSNLACVKQILLTIQDTLRGAHTKARSQVGR